jgi:hypothetical protein
MKDWACAPKAGSGWISLLEYTCKYSDLSGCGNHSQRVSERQNFLPDQGGVSQNIMMTSTWGSESQQRE